MTLRQGNIGGALPLDPQTRIAASISVSLELYISVYMEGFIIRGLDRVVPGREGTKSPPRTLCRGTITNRFKKLSLVTQTPMLCLSRQITSRRLSRAMRSTDLCLGLIHVLYLRHCSSFRDNLLEIRVGQFLGKTSY